VTVTVCNIWTLLHNTGEPANETARLVQGIAPLSS
jgi:hypothetical protein